MRTIKFRAWDIDREQMMSYVEQPFFQRDGSVSHVHGYYNESVPPKTLFSKEFELMQFTGLLDKNGNEIYEGDILKTESGVCEVKWYEKGACFRWMFQGNSESPLNYDDREIIGNIYQNPELLK